MNMTLGAVGYNGMLKNVAVSGYYITMFVKTGYDSYYINTWLKSPQAISLYKTFCNRIFNRKATSTVFDTFNYSNSIS